MGEGNQELDNTSKAQKTKAELQQQVEAKRDEMASTMGQIRTTLTREVRERKQSAKNAMDWKYYVKKQPVICVGGVAAVGFLIGKMAAAKAFDELHEPTWRERADGMVHDAEGKMGEWRDRMRSQGRRVEKESKSFWSSGTDMLFKELLKTAQHMIIPTVVAAVTGKMASDSKTTVVEKNVVKDNRPGRPDKEYTTGVTEIEDGEVKRKDPQTGETL